LGRWPTVKVIAGILAFLHRRAYNSLPWGCGRLWLYLLWGQRLRLQWWQSVDILIIIIV
jgi:hypothetical protein